MQVKRADDATDQVDSAMWLPCQLHHACPNNYHYFSLGDTCGCLFFGGGWKRDGDKGRRDPQVPPDVHSYCTHVMNGRCPRGYVGLWDQRNGGKCYCGPPKANVDLVPRNVLEHTSNPLNLTAYCAHALKGRCAHGTVALGNQVGGYCYCETMSEGTSVSAAGPTTADTVFKRLVPQPLKVPSGISSNDWTAIEVSLILLQDSIKTQPDLHKVCTGEKDPQAFGFKLEVFRRLCSPEIIMPVADSEIEKAKLKVSSAIWIDSDLQKHKNDVYGACDEAENQNVIPSDLDKQWIISHMCHYDT